MWKTRGEISCSSALFSPAEAAAASPTIPWASGKSDFLWEWQNSKADTQGNSRCLLGSGGPLASAWAGIIPGQLFCSPRLVWNGIFHGIFRGTFNTRFWQALGKNLYKNLYNLGGKRQIPSVGLLWEMFYGKGKHCWGNLGIFVACICNSGIPQLWGVIWGIAFFSSSHWHPAKNKRDESLILQFQLLSVPIFSCAFCLCLLQMLNLPRVCPWGSFLWQKALKFYKFC